MNSIHSGSSMQIHAEDKVKDAAKRQSQKNFSILLYMLKFQHDNTLLYF